METGVKWLGAGLHLGAERFHYCEPIDRLAVI